MNVSISGKGGVTLEPREAQPARSGEGVQTDYNPSEKSYQQRGGEEGNTADRRVVPQSTLLAQ